MMEWEAFIPDPPPKPDEAAGPLYVFPILDDVILVCLIIV